MRPKLGAPDFADRPIMRERIVLGPCVCQGCQHEVVYAMVGQVHCGWLHEDGRLVCRRRAA